MITGHEGNIRKCMSPEEAAKVTAEQDAVLVQREKVEQQIFNDWLKARRDEGKLQFISPQMHKPSTIEPGWPDYTILLSGGRTLLIEMKADGGKLSELQREKIQRLTALDHPVQVLFGHDAAIRCVEIFFAWPVKP
jgi:VRR-NUC domain-containing protein